MTAERLDGWKCPWCRGWNASTAGDRCQWCDIRHDGRTAGRQYAQGGYIGPSSPPGSVPIRLSPGCVFVPYSQYWRLGRDAIEALYPDSVIEVTFTADEVRQFSQKILEGIQRRLDGVTD